MENGELFRELLAEVRLLRQAIERIDTRLNSPLARSTSQPKPPRLSESECRGLYREMRAEYAQDRTTRGLDALLARSRSDLSVFCRANNLPVDMRTGKDSIRAQILARIREDEQLRATYPMARAELACVGERKD